MRVLHAVLAIILLVAARADDAGAIRRAEFLAASTNTHLVDKAALKGVFYLRLVIGGDFAPEQVCYEFYTSVPKSELFPDCRKAGGGFMVRTTPSRSETLEIDAGNIGYLFRLCEDYDLLSIPEQKKNLGYHTFGVEDPFDLNLFIYTPDLKNMVHRDSNSPAVMALWHYLKEMWKIKAHEAN